MKRTCLLVFLVALLVYIPAIALGGDGMFAALGYSGLSSVNTPSGLTVDGKIAKCLYLGYYRQAGTQTKLFATANYSKHDLELSYEAQAAIGEIAGGFTYKVFEYPKFKPTISFSLLGELGGSFTEIDPETNIETALALTAGGFFAYTMSRASDGNPAAQLLLGMRLVDGKRYNKPWEIFLGVTRYFLPVAE